MFVLSLLMSPSHGGRVPPGAQCTADKVAFDGACRDLAELAAWGAADADVIAVSGCGRLGDCSNVILFEEIKVTFKLRAVVLSDETASAGQKQRNNHPVEGRITREIDDARAQHLFGFEVDLDDADSGERLVARVAASAANLLSIVIDVTGAGFQVTTREGALPPVVETFASPADVAGLLDPVLLRDLVPDVSGSITAHAAGVSAPPSGWRTLESSDSEVWVLSLGGQDFW